MIFDAYEVSCRAGAEDLLYNAYALFRPGSGFPDQKIRRSTIKLLNQYNITSFTQEVPFWVINCVSR